MNALTRAVSLSEPALSAYAVASPPDGCFEKRFADGDRAFSFEAVHEGFLMHYERPRAFVGMDADLHLLAGDAMYALGLSRLAELGDLAAVAELADLITACARAKVEQEPGTVEELWATSAERLARAGQEA